MASARIVRHWALLIGLVGLFAVEGASAPPALGDKLINLSVRTQVPAGGTAIPGFVIEGEASTVLIRVAGPSLGAFGVTGTMANPTLTLFQGSTALAGNDDWAAETAAAAMVLDAATRSGAFAFIENSSDAALVVTLDPGAYTVSASSADGAAGEVLIEVYRVPPRFFTPLEAIVGAAAAVEEGITGTFKISVQASGADSRSGFLNSELDFRDQRCLTVEIPGALMQPLADVVGANPLTYYRGKTIEIDGIAKRVTIRVRDQNGDPTSVYYFQTQVALTDISKIRLVE